VGGILSVTLSENICITSSNYRAHAATEPWVSSIYASPLLSEVYKHTDGASTGQLVTTLPAGALKELLTAYGFEVERAACPDNFYPQNLDTNSITSITVIGARAIKLRKPDPDLLLKWAKHAKICEIIKNTNYSSILDGQSFERFVAADEEFLKKHEAINLKRRFDLLKSTNPVK
jgi:hypothetical protein